MTPAYTFESEKVKIKKMYPEILGSVYVGDTQKCGLYLVYSRSVMSRDHRRPLSMAKLMDR